jgi:hypothetical protein
MVLQKFSAALVGAALLMAGAASIAADYRADEFLGLDLSKAVLSPKPLGPATEFAPVSVEAKGDVRTHAANHEHARDAAQTRTGHNAAARRGIAMVHPPAAKSRGAARTRLAHRHGNPLDAQAFDAKAFDARIQTWPCRSGGICNWKQ